MPVEKSFIIVPHSGELNEYSVLKPAGYHELLCRVLEEVNANTGHALVDTLARGFAWAIISLTLEVKRPVRDCHPLSGRSWLSPMRFPYCRREIRITNVNGDTVAEATLFLVAMDLTTHRIINDRERLGGMEPELSYPLMPDAQRRMPEPDGLVATEQRVVRASDIDALGHMNNCRYAAFVYDTLTAEERAVFINPFRYVLDFRHQVAEGETVQIEKVASEQIYIRGMRTAPDAVSFICSIAPLADDTIRQ